jgi:hypothetical protein
MVRLPMTYLLHVVLVTVVAALVLVGLPSGMPWRPAPVGAPGRALRLLIALGATVAAVTVPDPPVSEPGVLPTRLHARLWSGPSNACRRRARSSSAQPLGGATARTIAPVACTVILLVGAKVCPGFWCGGP